jgi:type IV secretory pathway ATPase VirB11/archaellum biosynthesis ATPase/intein/homing endonuclease
MAFEPVKEPYSYDLIREGEETTLRIDCEKLNYIPSIEENAITMSKTIEILIETGMVSKIVFVQKRDYEYDFYQTQLLIEIANLFKRLSKKKDLFSYAAMGVECQKWFMPKYSRLQLVFFRLLKEDTLGAFVELQREHRRETIEMEKTVDKRYAICQRKYIDLIEYLIRELDKTRLISIAKPYLPGYKLGDRSAYRKIFRPTVKPDFMFTKLMAEYPEGATEIGAYTVGEDTDITVFKLPDSVQYLYHLMPPEFKLSEEKYELIDLARKVMAEHKPKKQEFVEPERMRAVFYNVGHDLIEELAEHRGVRLREKEIDELAEILVRYTVGFGLIEVLLQDQKMQDISINSPMGLTPIFIVHGDYGDCTTNIIPTPAEAESWASKLRMISGRPLDEANPILDTEIEIPGARARISAIAPPLNPFGLAYSFRRHRDKPWTLPLFIKNKYISPLAAGLISFIIDGTRTMLVAGTRSAGKTSLLGSVLVEIMRRYRIITVEDTLELPVEALRKLNYNIQQMKVRSALARGGAEVPADEGIRTSLRLGDSALFIGEVRSSLRGNQEVIIVENGLSKRIPIKNLQNKDLKSIYLPTLTDKNKIELKKLSGFAKHPKRNKLIKLITKTGREVVVTPDHSVFTHVNFKIAAINTDQLKAGDPIIIPSKLPHSYNNIDYANLLEVFKEDYRLENAENYIRKAIKKIGWKECSKICKIADIYRYLQSTQKTSIPIKHFIDLMKKANIKFYIKDLRIKRGTSNSIPAKFPINENVLRFIGYYLAEGNIDKNKIQITNSKPKIIEDITNICEKEFGLKVFKRKIKGLGSSIQMSIWSRPLRDLLVYLGCGKTSLYKRIPGFAYSLNEKKICALLKGMYSGDGSFSSTKTAGNMIRYFSTSKKLVEDVSYALLSAGIVCRIHNRKSNGKGHKRIFIAEIKQRKYIEPFLKNIGFTHKNPKMLIKSFPHSKDDSVSFNPKELEKHLKLPRKYRHLRRIKCCSKDYLKRITEEVKCDEEIFNFAHGDFFIDKIKSIEEIKLLKPEYVYDLEVKSTQRFIGGFGGILLHNTEALALYEAMRVGAMANVVAGTIHGESPYGVFDRVVNDLKVPRTSFKATDVVIVANPIRSPDGIHRWRRVTQITEVRKEWEEDPMLEHGFVDLMKYDAASDMLQPTDELINGNSDLLKAIAGNVKEWAGNWDAVWDNVLLRAKVKEAIVKASEKANDPDMLEAEFVIKANDAFHNISEEVREEVGSLDSERIFFNWDAWLKRAVKKREIKK